MVLLCVGRWDDARNRKADTRPEKTVRHGRGAWKDTVSLGWGVSSRFPRRPAVGRATARLPLNFFNAGDRCPQGSDPRCGHLRAPEAETAEPGQSLKVLQTGIRHPGFLQDQ